MEKTARTKEIAMKTKIRRPRSCLSYFLWLLGILLIPVLLHNLYAWAHIFAAHAAAYELAGELGYTPDDFLRSRGYPANVDIITGSAVCSAEFVFVTPLDLPDFEARLLAARPETWPIDPGIGYRSDIYADLPLNVNGVSGRPDAWTTFPRIPSMSWFLARVAAPMQTPTMEWYQTTQVPARITFGDREIDGNIAVISWSAGRYPFWVWC
jgi:hypothetical protein